MGAVASCGLIGALETARASDDLDIATVTFAAQPSRTPSRRRREWITRYPSPQRLSFAHLSLPGAFKLDKLK